MTMPISVKTRSIIEIAIALALIFSCCYSFENSEVVSPDGTLYHGLAHNLVDGDGYHDNIRNDFILPPVGHPLIILLANSLGLNDAGTFARLLLFLGLLFAFFSTIELKLPPFLRLLVIPLIFALIPTIYDWGVEATIFFTINLLLFAALRFINRYTLRAGLFLGFVIALNLLVRPVHGPFIYLIVLIAALAYFRHKKKVFLLLASLFVGLAIVNGTKLISKISFGDNRLSSGTYSEIPLYCANNKYINLEQVYYSACWQVLPEDEYEEAIAPLMRTTTWQNRAKVLREKVISFYKNHPGKAYTGISWRFSKFTIDQPEKLGNQIYAIWLAISILVLLLFRKRLFVLSKSTILNWIAFLLPIYTACILSLFVYVGERYNLTSNLVFILGLLLYAGTLYQLLKERLKLVVFNGFMIGSLLEDRQEF
jgi:hypothetical protein